MYVVMEAISIPLGNGRTVQLAPGPRGKRELRKGPNKPVIDIVDQDEALRRAVPPATLAALIESGKIVENDEEFYIEPAR